MDSKQKMKDIRSERLRDLRKERGISTKTLADDLRISAGSINGWENDDSSTGKKSTDGITLRNLVALAEYFGVSIDYLAGLTDVKALSPTLQGVCEFTGLSEKSVNLIHRLAEAKSNPPSGEIGMKNISEDMLKALNALLESKSIEFMLCFLNEYIQALANINHCDSDVLNGVRDVCWDIRAMGSHDVAELESAGYRVLSPSKAVDYAYFQVSDSFSDILKNELVKGAADDGEH